MRRAAGDAKGEVVVEITKLLNASPEEARDAWLHGVWQQGGGLPIIVLSDGIRDDDQRLLLPALLREKLVGKGPGASLGYCVTGWGAFFGCSDHDASVDFLPDEDGCKMTWRVRYLCVPEALAGFWQHVTSTFVTSAADGLQDVLKQPPLALDFGDEELDAPPDRVANAFLDYTWRQGGGFPGNVSIISEGDKSTREDFTRFLLPLGLVERICNVTWDSEGACVIRYTIDNPGLWTLYPVVSHSASVSLRPNGSGRTTLRWKVRCRPWHGCAPLVEGLTRIVVGTLVANLKSYVS